MLVFLFGRVVMVLFSCLWVGLLFCLECSFCSLVCLVGRVL